MIKTRLGHIHDIPGVLSLQEKYLYKNLNDLERKKGFVTTPFTVSQIEEIIQQNGLFIAEILEDKSENNQIIAYAFAGSWKYFEQWEIFKVMTSQFPELSFHGIPITTENSFQYGPVCIDENFRGKGLLNQLFEEMRIEFFKKYPISITFINKINAISEKAHTKKLGWEKLNEFTFNTNYYLGLAFDMKNSVVK